MTDTNSDESIGSTDEDESTDSVDAPEPTKFDSIRNDEQLAQEVFGTETEEERIDAALDFAVDEDTPATLTGLLTFVRESDDIDVPEHKYRSRARERGLIDIPDDPAEDN